MGTLVSLLELWSVVVNVDLLGGLSVSVGPLLRNRGTVASATAAESIEHGSVLMNLSLFGYLTIVDLIAVLVFATLASVFVKRLLSREPVPMSGEVGSVPTVLRKLRKREPMSDDELAFAKQVVSDRRS